MDPLTDNQMNRNDAIELLPIVKGRERCEEVWDLASSALNENSFLIIPEECSGTATEYPYIQPDSSIQQLNETVSKQVNVIPYFPEYNGAPRNRLEITRRLLNADSEIVMHASTVVSSEDRSKMRMMEEFANKFRMDRINYGFTQGEVGAALGEQHGTDFSQTTVSRFESLNLSFKNMSKLFPLLVQWLDGVERSLVNGSTPRSTFKPANHPEMSTGRKRRSSVCSYVLSGNSQLAVSSHKRRRRTSIEKTQRSTLDAHFAGNPHPDNETINKIASNLSLSHEVVKVWFCNRRQKVRKHEV